MTSTSALTTTTSNLHQEGLLFLFHDTYKNTFIVCTDVLSNDRQVEHYREAKISADTDGRTIHNQQEF